MTNPATDPRETILLQCADAAPNPWYPKDYAQAHGLIRDSLDPHLDELRLGGLIHLTDWVQGKGQGYQLTAEGKQFLESPGVRDRLRAGERVARRPASFEAPSPENRAGHTTAWDRGEAVREALLSPSNPVVTRALIVANIMVFAGGLMLAQRQQINASDFLSGTGQGVPGIVHDTGALFGPDLLPDVLHGQWWRLLTTAFVHFGLLHIGMNMLALYSLGRQVERMWGPGRYLVIYLLAALGGSCLVVVAKPVSLLAGASGAICGIFGAAIAWTVLNRRSLPRELFSAWMRNALMNALLLVFISSFPRVSAMAHLGGAIVGVIAAVLLHYQRFGPSWLRMLALAGVVVLPVASVGAVVAAQHMNPQWRELTEEFQREKQQQERHLRREKREQDLHQFNDEVLPAVRKLHEGALKAFEANAASLLEQKDPKKRDRAAVEKAVAALAKAREQLAEADQLLEKAGPYEEPVLEKARATRREYLRERMKYFEMVERYLQEGQGNDAALVEQAKQVQAAGRRWGALLQ